MRTIALLFLSGCFASTQVAIADDAAEIQKLIPAASAMAKADFDKLAMSDVPLKASDLDEQSLTLLLFLTPCFDDAAKREQFRYFGCPKPSILAAEMRRKPGFAPITMIHANRITGITCDVKDDTARGVVSFEVPKLYAGKVHYVARKQDGKWRIEEFALPAYNIQVAHGQSGKWEQK